MTIKTRLFGKKIKGETLHNLVDALGENWETIAIEKHEKFTITNLYGKCNLIPKEKDIEIDLYVFRTDTHYVDGSYHEDYQSGEYGEGPIIRKGIIQYSSVKHLQGKIPYKI